MKKVLNVGGNSKDVPLPNQYDGWEHILLDIDPTGNPDIVCDARELITLPPSVYDSIYCSHNLEHYYHHEVPKVLAGFIHVLKDDGFVYIRVPDIKAVVDIMVTKQLDIDDVIFSGASPPILVRDVIYGWGIQIEQSGCDFWAHKTGFTEKSLINVLKSAGFSWIFTTCSSDLEVRAIAFKNNPADYALKLFGLPS